MKKPIRVLIIAVIALAVIAVILAKSATGKNRRPAEPVAVNPLPAADSSSPTQPVSLNPATETTRLVPVEQPPDPQGSVLATVNGTPLTEEYLQQMYKSLPEPNQSQFQNDLEGLLEQLITRELLYQEARKNGFASNLPESTNPEEKKDRAIGLFLQDRANRVVVDEAEIRQFYEQRKGEMNNAPYDQVRADLKNYLLQEKQGKMIDQLIDSLKARAVIKRNEKWLAQQRAKRPPDPLTPALKSGKPTVLDLGASTCVPCKMMKPIFEELKKEYGDRANILLLEISEYRQIANRYNVRIIPTQIFFDRQGNLYWRHEGYLPKEEIVKKLRELGVE
jgi:thioredoxin 1